jgi:predicted TIM-barrel fold metal-dependent hydrolase
MILDTHLHLVYPDRFSYPAVVGDPELARSWPLETYLAEARPLGISRMIHMEVCVADSDVEAETVFVTGLPSAAIVGAVSSCRPETADFPALLERLSASRKVVGFRRVLHTENAEIARAPLFRENVRRLAGRYTFDICALPGQLPEMASLAAACPDVTFVLDHCGIPPVRQRALDPWREDIRRLAALDNVVCKISGVIAYGDPNNWTAADLKPYVEHCIATFGWSRVVWGSGWPICTRTANLTRWVEATHELVGGASDAEKAALLSRNAERIYRLNPA